MSIGDALKFEKSWIGDIWKGIKRDPKRLILGVDPLSTKAWNAVLGRNDKPVVGHLGGPTKESYQHAQDKGIDTGTASTLHGIAKAVAGAYGAYGAAGGIGNAAGSVGTVGAGGGATGGTVGAGTGAGVAGGAAAGAAIPEVVVTGTAGSGVGAGTAAAAGAGAGAASSSNGSNWRQYAQMGGQQDNSQEDAAAEERRRQMEQMIEQERLRRESFRRDAIARAMSYDTRRI